MRVVGREAGLTLVEMLVVLAIIGIASGVAVLGFGAGKGVNVEAEAHTLASKLRLAADISMVTDRRILLAWDTRSYSFLGWDATAGRWAPETGTSLGGRHELPAGFALAIPGTSPAALAADGTGQGIDATISNGGRRWQVLFDGFAAVAVPVKAAS